jgi:hypothetical protein
MPLEIATPLPGASTAIGPTGVRTGSKLSSELGSDEPSDEPPSTVAEQVAARLLGDEAELYLEFNRQLVRTVQKCVDASRDTVDDACAFAWVQFMRLRPDRDRNWRSWLITTAEREVWRLTHQEGRTIGFEVRDSDELEYEPQDPCDRIQERADLRHALDLLLAVPSVAGRRSVARNWVTRTTRPAACSGSASRA